MRRTAGLIVLVGLGAAGVFFGRLDALETAASSKAMTGTAVVSQEYRVGYAWMQDVSGTSYGPYAVLDFKQKLFNSFTAEMNARIFKPAGSDDGADLGLEIASVSYVGSWFSVSGGRRDLGSTVSPGCYFGAYSTMGERQLDSVSLTFPFRLFADIPDADAQVKAPYNAVTLLYAPNLFDAEHSSYDGTQGLLLAQLRVKFRIKESSSDLYINYSRGLEDYFINTPLCGAGGVDAAYALHLGIWGCFADWSLESLMTGPAASSVIAAGTSLEIKKVSFGLLDSAVFEAEVPLGWGPENPFTGGDPQNPALATDPQWCWFVKVTNRLGTDRPNQPLRLFYGGALTNAIGDYTLSRLAEGSLSVPVGDGFGVGPRVEGFAFRSSSYASLAGIVYAGYEF